MKTKLLTCYAPFDFTANVLQVAVGTRGTVHVRKDKWIEISLPQADLAMFLLSNVAITTCETMSGSFHSKPLPLSTAFSSYEYSRLVRSEDAKSRRRGIAQYENFLAALGHTTYAPVPKFAPAETGATVQLLQAILGSERSVSEKLKECRRILSSK